MCSRPLGKKLGFQNLKYNYWMPKKYVNLILMILFFVITAGAYFVFSQTSSFKHFVIWTQDNILLYAIFLICVKILGIVYPPIPGGILTLASIPMLGWIGAYLVDFIGSTIGGVICYFLGRRYGLTLLRKIFDEKVVQKMEGLKVKKGKELEAIILWRILAGGTIIEAVYYAAGLLKIGFGNFFLGTTISHVIIGIPSFYLGGAILSSQNILINVFLLGIALVVLYKAKGRYFE